MAERFDISTTKKWRKDKRQRLIVDSTPTRAGVFTYYEPDGMGGFKSVKELRHPDEVFSRETLDSLKVIPYTTQEFHTSLMTPENVRNRTYGTTLSDVEREGDHAKVGIKVNDGDEIKAILGSKSLELSCGYDCDIIKEPGEYNGEKYDQRQVNIIYDHVARVEKARGGESCRIRLDSNSAICGIEAERLDSGINSHNEENMTEKATEVILEKELPARVSGGFRLDADSVKIPQDLSSDFAKMKDREEKLFSELKKISSENTEKQVKLDAQDKKIQDLERQVQNTIPADRLDSEVMQRLDLWDLAKEYNVKDFKDMSQKELKMSIVKASKVFGDVSQEKLDSEGYLDFACDHLKTDHAKSVSQSRQNLDAHKDFKFDAYGGDDLLKPSALEQA